MSVARMQLNKKNLLNIKFILLNLRCKKKKQIYNANKSQFFENFY